MFVFESYKFLESSYSFELSKNTLTVSCIRGLVSFSCQYCQVMPCPCSREFWSYVHSLQSIYLLSCWSSLSQSRTSLCCPVFSKTYLVVFRVDDGGFIMALLWWVYSFRLQLFIQELDLETKSNTLGLHDLMAGYLAFNMSLHHWLLIERSHRVFESKSFIHIRWYVLWYLRNHWHKWWFPSHLLTVYIIDW